MRAAKILRRRNHLSYFAEPVARPMRTWITPVSISLLVGLVFLAANLALRVRYGIETFPYPGSGDPLITAYDRLQRDPRVSYADDPLRVEPQWRTVTQRETFSPKVWNDAYLAAFAMAATLELVTFDRGCAVYHPAGCTVLS